MWRNFIRLLAGWLGCMRNHRVHMILQVWSQKASSKLWFNDTFPSGFTPRCPTTCLRLSSQQIGAARPFQRSAVDCQQVVLEARSLEVNNNLCFFNIKREMLSLMHVTSCFTSSLQHFTSSLQPQLCHLQMCLGSQSRVSGVKSRGLSTQPWGTPVFGTVMLDDSLSVLKRL